MIKIVLIHFLAVFGTVLSATYTPSRISQLQPPGGDVADSSFRWRFAPDDDLARDSTQSRGREGALDVKGLYKRVLFDLGKDRVLLETEAGCANCQTQFDTRGLAGIDGPILPDRFQDTGLDTRSRITTIDESSRTISSNEAGLRHVPFPPYSLNVGEVRTVKLPNGDRIRVTASKPNQQAPPKPFLPQPSQNFPSRSGPVPSFSPKVSGPPTKKGLIQIGPKMYIRVTANKAPAPPPAAPAFQTRFQQPGIQQSELERYYGTRRSGTQQSAAQEAGIQQYETQQNGLIGTIRVSAPLPPVTRPPLTAGVDTFYATTEQPCSVEENELPLSPGHATGSRLSELIKTDVETRANFNQAGGSQLPVSPFATHPSSRTTSRITETSDSFSSRTEGSQQNAPSGLPVSPFPTHPSSRTTSRLSEETPDSFTSKSQVPQGNRPTGLPVSPFANNQLPVAPSPKVTSRVPETSDDFEPRSGGSQTSGRLQETGLPVSPFPRDGPSGKQNVVESNAVGYPSRGYIPPYGSLAPPTRPPLTQGVADQYSQNSQGSPVNRNAGGGSASDPNKKLIQVGPGQYIRVTANKDQPKP